MTMRIGLLGYCSAAKTVVEESGAAMARQAQTIRIVMFSSRWNSSPITHHSSLITGVGPSSLTWAAPSRVPLIEKSLAACSCSTPID